MASVAGISGGVGGISPVKPAGGLAQESADGGSFVDILKQSVGNAIDAQRKSEEVTSASLLGNASMTDVLQATNNAEVALNTVLAIRDRLVQAWQEIMRSQI